jgi:hypothetical protein
LQSAMALACGGVRRHAAAFGDVRHGGMATATCSFPPIVAIVVSRSWGQRRRVVATEL